MTQTEIKRMSLKPTTEFECLPSMATEAEAVLGYKRPEPGQREGSNVLLDALVRLEISVLDWRDVFIYMAERKSETEMVAARRRLADDEPTDYKPTECQWWETEIKDFRGTVPDHVLSKAVEIKRAVPDVTLGVVHLSESRDPFLVASIQTGTYSFQRARYFIEVWDEPGFEGR